MSLDIFIMDFAFPDLSKRMYPSEAPTSGPATSRLPLTAFSTVTHARSVRQHHEDEPSPTDVMHKVTSEKAGKSQMDYLRLESGERAGPSQALRHDIPLSELRLHDKAGDAWICLKGKVYDMSSYVNVSEGVS